MPTWNDLFNEIKDSGGTHDILRRKYLKKLSDLTGRNTIIYYSGWLQKPEVGRSLSINDNDKNGFMTTIQGLDRSKGLDLILHTPGGDAFATESLVDYLRSIFPDMRAIIPQLAMSGGTMISCACKSIMMGKQSSLGPIDPQIAGTSAHGILEEFDKAYNELIANPKTAPIWQPILAKYPAGFIGDCRKAVDWSSDITKTWLLSGMLQGERNADSIADNIITELSDHGITKSHARHLSISKCKEIGLKIDDMEDDHDIQDAILTVHHIAMLTLQDTSAVKIIENQNAKAFVLTARLVRQV